MFLNTNALNEGANQEKHEEGRKRELREGNNPKEIAGHRHNSSATSHSNARWQDLRK